MSRTLDVLKHHSWAPLKWNSGQRILGATPSANTRFGWDAASMPRWPFSLPFVSYALCWVLGISDLIWILAAVLMLGVLLRSRQVRLPSGAGLWILFLVWVCASTIMVDTFGRMIGAGYRFALYLAAGITALYVFNAYRTLTLRYVTGIMTIFLLTMTAGGFLAMVFPLLTVHTPMSWVMPQALASNELVGEMIVRRTTQWNPDAWVPQEPRPSAPFVYTNTWGNVYSLVLPLVIIYLTQVWRSRRRWAVLLLIIASLVPAAATLNRGMFLGLGVVGAWCAVQALRRGSVGRVLAGGVVVGTAGLVWLASGAATTLRHRAETSSSVDDRGELYIATLQGALKSPLFGYGAPRPAAFPWLPSMGTQGQFWTVVFSHGFIGLAFFIGFFLVAAFLILRRTDAAGAVFGGIILATLVETFYYGMMTGLTISLIAVALLRRPDTQVVSRSGPPGRSDQRPATRRRRVSV